MEKEKALADLVVELYKMRDGKDPDKFALTCLKAVQEIMPTATKMTREPFGFIYDTDGEVYFTVVNATGEKLVVETHKIGTKEKPE